MRLDVLSLNQLARGVQKMAERFRNDKTWKQISTNVPAPMYQALKKQVTKERTMSHLLRELIQESEVMRYGTLPKPSWSKELCQDLAALKDEVVALRKELISMAETRAFEGIDFEQDEVLAPHLFNCQPDEDDELAPETVAPIEPEKEKPPSIIGRLTKMLKVVAKTA